MKEKISLSPKATLLLDLDETTFIALSEDEYASHGSSQERIKALKGIHPSHTLSLGVKNSGFYFFVLNPERLKSMIEDIYKQGDDIVIFTAGLWLSPVLIIVAQLCNLNAEYALKFQNALFLNPQHDGTKLGYSAEAIRTLLKGYRLHGLFRAVEKLRNCYFVLLDNNKLQIESCAEVPYLTGVTATTDQDDLSFYNKVLTEMQLARTSEVSLSPSRPAYAYTKAIFQAYLQLEQQSVAPVATVS